MRPNPARRLSCEELEDRSVPATVNVINGNLFVSGPAGPLTVETTANAG